MILLDTHVLIWMAAEPKLLTRKAREAISAARNQGGVGIAAITLWELAWLAQNRRIQISGSVESFVRETTARVLVKTITAEIAARAVRLGVEYPKDPADRLIGATAIEEGLSLVTADMKIQNSKLVKTVW